MLVIVAILTLAAVIHGQVALPFAQINILSVTDSHSWIAGHKNEPYLDANYGHFVSFIQHVRDEAQARGVDLFVFDVGDLTDGTGLSDATIPKGEALFPLIAMMPFDALATANHELYTNDRIALMRESGGFIDQWNGAYLTSNAVMSSDQSLFGKAAYKIMPLANGGGGNIMILGFMFHQTDAASLVDVLDPYVACQQPWFGEAMNISNIVSYVVLIHADLAWEETQDVRNAIRSFHPDTPIVLLTGHTHYRGFRRWDNASCSIEYGRYFNTIGFTSWDVSSTPFFNTEYIDTNVNILMHISGKSTYSEFMTVEGQEMEDEILAARATLSLDTVVGCSPLTYDTGADLSEPNSMAALYLYEMAPKTLFAHHVGNGIPWHVVSTGGFREDLYAGENTVDDMYIASPFRNTYWYQALVPGVVVAQITGVLNTRVSRTQAHRDWLFEWLEGQGVDVKDWLSRGEAEFTRLVETTYFQLPNFVATNDAVDPEALYDVIYSNYDEPAVLAAIQSITGTAPPPSLPYRTDLDSSTLFIVFYEGNMPCGDSADDGLSNGAIAGIVVAVVVVVGLVAAIVMMTRNRGNFIRVQ